MSRNCKKCGYPQLTIFLANVFGPATRRELGRPSRSPDYRLLETADATPIMSGGAGVDSAQAALRAQQGSGESGTDGDVER
jgi:hypothetical protein